MLKFFTDLTALGRVLVVAVIVGVVGGGGWWVLNNTNIIPGGSGGRQVATGGNVVNVCVVTWVGYAGGQYYNGGFSASRDSRFHKEQGVLVNYVVNDDVGASLDAWKAGECDLHWYTVESLPTLFPDLISAGYSPKIVHLADWSRGGDVVVCTRGVTTVANMAGKRVSFAFGTPSHAFVLRMLQAAGMTLSDIEVVEVADAPTSAQAFTSREVDCAAVWSPDDAAAIEAVAGAHKIWSTRDARYIIADVFFAHADWIDSHQEELTGVIEGWMIGAAELHSDPSARSEAVDILTDGLQMPREWVDETLDNARQTTYGDNEDFFALRGSSRYTSGEQLYNETGRLYRDQTRLISGAVPPWRSVIDLRALRAAGENLTGPEHAMERALDFSAPTEAMENVAEISSRAIAVTFNTGSAELGTNAKTLIDEIVAPLARAFAGNRIRIEGNTDNTGSYSRNVTLSEQRAQSVANYLADEYGFDPDRFVVVGRGPDNPVATNATSAGRAQNRRTEVQMLPGS